MDYDESKLMIQNGLTNVSSHLMYGESEPTYGIVNESGKLVQEATSIEDPNLDLCSIADLMSTMDLDSDNPIDTSSDCRSDQTSGESPKQKLRPIVCNSFEELINGAINFNHRFSSSNPSTTEIIAKVGQLRNSVATILSTEGLSDVGRTQMCKIKTDLDELWNVLIPILDE
ncbi:hypothetical protein COEREDRAFT_86291 [Coemansia reversa NRRL 1564]|uniref:Uncharacterized protein n=1 Tax=Coemansia reversa (strain ATCC 12441 / NRRL 1564) TaxID=763665 RepID=A0A2G5BE61_COERN|nr:hypothetical protein COEREDRAFT_86291 [Coemansia reversa NRRL 1564]|eukprot:PIA17294.1 hypothetical protein COEREDRAFT_86291 [Coemansia reversa NRRL 1564]